MLQQLPQPQPEGGAIPPQQEIQYCLPQRVVHHAVQLMAHQVLAVLTVGFLAAGVLPYLPDDEGIGLFGAGRLADHAYQLIGVFIHHIQPPAIGAQPQPVPHNAVFSAEEFPPALVPAVELGETLEAPPALVHIGGGILPAVPAAVGAARIAVGAAGAVAALLIEVQAIAAGVIEHAVQDDFDAVLMGPLAQGDEILLGAQQRVDAQVVGGIVAVVAVRLKDGIEVQDPDAQSGQLRQLFGDAGQITAKIIIAAEHAVGIGGALRLLLPVAVQPPVGGDTGLLPAAVIVTVREDLIHHLPGEFLRNIVGLIVDGKLPQLPLAVIGAAIGRAVQQGAIRKAEAIVIKPRLLRGAPQGKGIALPAQRGMQQGLRLPGPVQQQGGRAGIALGQGKAQGHFLPRRHRAEGRFMFRQQAVKHGCCPFVWR